MFLGSISLLRPQRIAGVGGAPVPSKIRATRLSGHVDLRQCSTSPNRELVSLPLYRSCHSWLAICWRVGSFTCCKRSPPATNLSSRAYFCSLLKLANGTLRLFRTSFCTIYARLSVAPSSSNLQRLTVFGLSSQKWKRPLPGKQTSHLPGADLLTLDLNCDHLVHEDQSCFLGVQQLVRKRFLQMTACETLTGLALTLFRG